MVPYFRGKPERMRTSLLLSALALAPATFAQLVINEVDYDQPGTDAAEYIELKNTSTSAVYPMQYVRVALVNGNSGTAVVYATFASPSWAPLAPGAYFTLCADPLAGCDAALTPATNAVQNGELDAIVLLNVTDSTIIDALGYEGSLTGATEGTGLVLGDDNVTADRSVGRFPDGVDTNDNDADFVRMCTTPGAANSTDTLDCGLPTNIATVPEGPSLFTFLDGSGMLWMQSTATGPVTFEVRNVQGALLAHRTLDQGRNSWAWAPGDRATGIVVVRVIAPSGSRTQRILLP